MSRDTKSAGDVALDDAIKIDHPRMILGAVGLAMGIAVFVMSILKIVSRENAIMLLSIAVICFGISALLPKR